MSNTTVVSEQNAFNTENNGDSLEKVAVNTEIDSDELLDSIVNESLQEIDTREKESSDEDVSDDSQSDEDESELDSDSDVEIVDLSNDKFYQILRHLFEDNDGNNVVDQISKLSDQMEVHNNLLKLVVQQLSSMQVSTESEPVKKNSKKSKKNTE